MPLSTRGIYIRLQFTKMFFGVIMKLCSESNRPKNNWVSLVPPNLVLSSLFFLYFSSLILTDLNLAEDQVKLY